MSDKLPLSNKTDFQAFCIVMAVPINFLLFIASLLVTIGLLFNRDWNFGYGILGIIVFGMNTKSILALMDYPDT